VAAFSVLFVMRYTSELESRITASPDVKSSITAQSSRLADIEVKDPGVRREVDESFVAAFRVTMLVAAGLALASAMVAFVGIPSEPAGKPA
jgi:hypothetical protein